MSMTLFTYLHQHQAEVDMNTTLASVSYKENLWHQCDIIFCTSLEGTNPRNIIPSISCYSNSLVGGTLKIMLMVMIQSPGQKNMGYVNAIQITQPYTGCVSKSHWYTGCVIFKPFFSTTEWYSGFRVTLDQFSAKHPIGKNTMLQFIFHGPNKYTPITANTTNTSNTCGILIER